MEVNTNGIINTCQERYHESSLKNIINGKDMYGRDFQKFKTIITVDRNEGMNFFHNIRYV